MQPNSMLIRMTDLLPELLIGERISGSNTSQVFLNCKRRYGGCNRVGHLSETRTAARLIILRVATETASKCRWRRAGRVRSPGGVVHTLTREWSFVREELVAMIGRPASTTSGLIFPLRNPYRVFPDRPPSRRRDERPPDSEVRGGSLGESSCCRPETCLRGRHGRQTG